MTLIETHFPGSTESRLRPAVAGGVEQHPEGESTPRALVTLIHNSDRRSVEAAVRDTVPDRMKFYRVRLNNLIATSGTPIPIELPRNPNRTRERWWD